MFYRLTCLIGFLFLLCPCLVRAEVIPVKTAHIYLDLATFPMLLQMIDLVQQPDSEPKFIAWTRYNNWHKGLKKIAPDAMVSSLRNPSFTENLKRFKESHPNHFFYIHLNAWHDYLIQSVLSVFSPYDPIRIESYEDALYQFRQRPADILKRWGEHMNYPIRFHLADPGYFQTTACQTNKDCARFFTQVLRQAQMRPIDLKERVNNLTPQQKSNFMTLIGMDKAFWDKQTHDKRILFYIGGFDAAWRQNNLYQAFILKSLCATTDKNDVLIYKPHPAWDFPKEMKEDLSTLCSNWVEAPARLPFETFILTGYEPDKIYGFSSSAFFSAPIEKIESYMKRRIDLYLPILKELGLKETALIDLTDFFEKAPLFKKERAVLVTSSKGRDWLIFSDKTSFCQQTFKTCGELLEETDKTLTLVWEKDKKETVQIIKEAETGLWE